MRIDIISIFPNVFKPYFDESILKIAQKKNKLKIHLHNLRDYTLDRHRKVDDRPFGGGAGMVMMAEPIFRAVEKIKSQAAPTLRSGQAGSPDASVGAGRPQVILLSPKGKTLNQKLVQKLSKRKHLILICGRYEGVDERVRRYLADEEISIGDYVLTGGELAAMVVVDAAARILPGVLGDESSAGDESYSGNLLEYPHYSRPANFRRLCVPRVLLSGNHKKIEEWRRKEALMITKRKRPDLLRI
jgi:tRNA (guanine37-N1)-methyltransferase